MLPHQVVMEMDAEHTVVDVTTGKFHRHTLSLHDPPLVSINCTSNCGEVMYIVLGNLTINVSTVHEE